MYRYEELDYNQIMNHSEIDPNSAEAYYALAQCFRQGKGIEPDMDMYQEYLGYAAEEGHENAARELDALQGQQASQKNAVPVQMGTVSPTVKESEMNYESMTVSELRRLSNLGDAAAAFRLYSVSKNIGDTKNAVLYLKSAGDYAEKNGVEKAAGQKIFMALGEMYKQGSEKDLQKSLRAYEMAAELGSSQACNYLSDCYRNGVGGVLGKDAEQAERYRRMVARNGGVGERYRLAVTYMKENENLLAMELLQQVISETGSNEDFHLLSRIQLGRMDPKNYSCEDLLERLWERANQTVNKKLAKEARAELFNLYKKGPESKEMSEYLRTALTPERAYLFGMWRKSSDPNKAKQWFSWAAGESEDAWRELVVMNEAEEERKRLKAAEDEQKKAETAALTEQKRKEAAEREERKKKEAEEKAERERLAAIEAEKLRQEKEEQDRQERIEAEARALVLKEERAQERKRKKDEEARKAEYELILKEQERIRKQQEEERKRELQEANRRYLQNMCKKDTKHYVGRFIKYLLIAGVWTFMGLIAAILTFNESKGVYLFCRWFGSAGTAVWFCLLRRMNRCVKALKKRYPGTENHHHINMRLTLQRILMWPLAFVWIMNGVIAENMSWIGFFCNGILLMVAAVLIGWVVAEVLSLDFLEDALAWIQCEDEI